MNFKQKIYFFSQTKTDGDQSMSEILGGKGANLAEMCKLGLPVPPGFTLATSLCGNFLKHKKLSTSLKNNIKKYIKKTEKAAGGSFGGENPLLLSVRSGAPVSMPGMMETVLNIGLTSETIPHLIGRSGSERFAYDSYRRLIMMYADVVMEKSLRLNKSKKPINIKMEKLLKQMKKRYKYKMTLHSKLQTLISDTNLQLSEYQIKLLIQYIELLNKWNKAYNLTSVRDPQEMLVKHIMDSLMVGEVLTGNNFIDVGTGPGLPGIPLSILYPEKNFVLIFPDNNKTNHQLSVFSPFRDESGDLVLHTLSAPAEEEEYSTIVTNDGKCTGKVSGISPDQQFKCSKTGCMRCCNESKRISRDGFIRLHCKC